MLGIVLTKVARSCAVTVSVMDALGMGVGISFAAPGMLGVGRSLTIPAMLGVGTSFPTAGILGADVSFPGSLSFPFLGEKTDPIDPRTERGKSLIVSGRELED